MSLPDMNTYKHGQYVVVKYCLECKEMNLSYRNECKKCGIELIEEVQYNG